MLSLRASALAGLLLIAPLPAPSAWADTLDDGLTVLQLYLCQFGDTANVYGARQGLEGQLEGLGQLQGWNVTVKDDGLVATNSGTVFMVSRGSATLVQQGQLVQGQCVDVRSDMAQLVTPENTPAAPRDGLDGQVLASPDNSAGLPAQVPSDAWVAGVLSLLDQGAWDPEQVAALVDALTLDNSAKVNLKAELRAAGKDQARIASVARQIQRAFGLEIAAAADLRVKLRAAKGELATMTQALAEQRRITEDTMAQLAAAQTKTHAAERANNQTTALLGAAQRALSAKDIELAKSAQDVALLNQQVTTMQGQLGAFQGALVAAATKEAKAKKDVAALTAELVEMRGRLARANTKIDELRAASR